LKRAIFLVKTLYVLHGNDFNEVRIRNNPEKQWYYQKYTGSILRRYKSELGPELMQKQIPSRIEEAWEGGFRVSFKMFIQWIAAGNKAADEHWTPVSLLCGICDGNWQFIGHSEHFDEDIHVSTLYGSSMAHIVSGCPNNMKH